MSDFLNVPIILASSSPRRVELMRQVGLSVVCINPTADETPRRGEKPVNLVKRLAREKAESVVPQVLRENASAVIVAADTIVVEPAGKRIFGKPRDVAEAEKMLKQISGKTHTVFTGYCIYEAIRGGAPKIRVRVVMSKVKIRKLSKNAISRYIASEEPMDKAGAYAAQGLGTALIERISGSYTNVVGLPIADILEDLQEEFGISLFSWNHARRPESKAAL